MRAGAANECTAAQPVVMAVVGERGGDRGTGVHTNLGTGILLPARKAVRPVPHTDRGQCAGTGRTHPRTYFSESSRTTRTAGLGFSFATM